MRDRPNRLPSACMLITHAVSCVPVTYHQYVNCVPSGSDATVLPLDCLEAIHSTGDVYAPIAQGGGVQLWVGESAEHSGGGIEGLTNTFTSSFFYAYQMGVIGMVNGSVTARQDLIGGHCERAFVCEAVCYCC